MQDETTLNIELTEQQYELLERLAQDGRFGSDDASVMRQALEMFLSQETY